MVLGIIVWVFACEVLSDLRYVTIEELMDGRSGLRIRKLRIRGTVAWGIACAVRCWSAAMGAKLSGRSTPLT